MLSLELVKPLAANLVPNNRALFPNQKSRMSLADRLASCGGANGGSACSGTLFPWNLCLLASSNRATNRPIMRSVNRRLVRALRVATCAQRVQRRRHPSVDATPLAGVLQTRIPVQLQLSINISGEHGLTVYVLGRL